MVNDTFVECLVARKTPSYMKFLKILLIMLAVAFFVIGFMGIGILGLIIAAAFGVAAYFVHMNSEIEYEYSYVEKTVDVDRIKAQSKRKRMATYEIESMEIMAPMGSYHLDDYKNRDLKVRDYSSGESTAPEKRYVMICDGGEKVIFEPNEAMINAIYTVAPRKVFKD